MTTTVKTCNYCHETDADKVFHTGTQCHPCYIQRRKDLLLSKERICKHCQETNENKKFRSTLVCNECHNKLANKKNNNKVLDLDHYLMRLLSSAAANSKKKGEKGRTDAGECTITLEDLKNIYYSQGGLCYYCKVQMSLKTFSDWQCSLERKDPSKGYTVDNVTLICQEFQGACQWDGELFKQFVEWLHMTFEPQKMNWVYQRKDSDVPTLKPTKHMKNGVEERTCMTCNIFKPNDQFAPERNSCKACTHNVVKMRRSTPSGHFQRMRGNMISSSQRRDHDLPEFKNDVDLVALWEKQNGLCAYSGIPMVFGTSHWACSPERLDVNVGYTKNNTVFILRVLNTASHTAHASTPELVTGSGGWSKEKIEKIKEMFAKI